MISTSHGSAAKEEGKKMESLDENPLIMLRCTKRFTMFYEHGTEKKNKLHQSSIKQAY